MCVQEPFRFLQTTGLGLQVVVGAVVVWAVVVGAVVVGAVVCVVLGGELGLDDVVGGENGRGGGGGISVGDLATSMYFAHFLNMWC
jgi:hypothetical protein